MANDLRQKQWQSAFLKEATDDQLLSPEGRRNLYQKLEQAKRLGLTDDAFLQKFDIFQRNRVNAIRNKPIIDPQTKQPQYFVDPQGRARQARIGDLFVGGQFRPDLGVQGVATQKQQTLEDLQKRVQDSVARANQTIESLTPSSPLAAAGTYALRSGQAVTETLRSIPTQLQILASGVTGGLLKPPTPEELRKAYIQSDPSEMTPDQAWNEAMKPARAAGVTFSQGFLPTIAGIVGSQAAGAGIAATGVGTTAAGPLLTAGAIAAASYGAGLGMNKLQDIALRKAYGDEVYENQILPLFDEMRKQSGSASIAGDMANVLLQGSPTLQSGVGTRKMVGLLRSAWKGETATLTGTAGQLGQFAPKIGQAVDGAALPNVIARSPNKYEALVSPMLQKFGAATSEAVDRFKIFDPGKDARFMARARALGQFVRDTPGAADWVADAVGEQAMNLGQAAVDYTQQLERSKRTGETPNTLEALTNLAFGSIFIGNNKFTDIVGAGSQRFGAASLNAIGKVPGLGDPVEALKKRYDTNNDTVIQNFLKSQARAQIESPNATQWQQAAGVRSRVGGTAAQDADPEIKRLLEMPGTQVVPIGNGQAAILHNVDGSDKPVTTIVPYGSVFNDVDDTATVELGRRMGSAVENIPTERVGSTIDRMLRIGNESIRQHGDHNQQVIGISRVANSDEAHVVIREAFNVENTVTGESRTKVITDIVPVSDLEPENQSVAAKMIEDAGLIPAITPYAEVGGIGVTVDGQDLTTVRAIKDWQEAYAEPLKEYAREFVTGVRLESNSDDILRARVIGREKNGDVRLQLMAPSMTVIRVSPAAIVHLPNGVTTLTQALEPVSIQDVMNEQSVSTRMIPRMNFDGQNQWSVFPDYGTQSSTPLQGKLQTVTDENGNKQTVLLTIEQRRRLPSLLDEYESSVREARQRTGDEAKVSQAAANARRKLLSKLFNGGFKPKSNLTYEIGKPLAVSVYEFASDVQQMRSLGTEPGADYVTGVVVDNTESGPSVVFPQIKDDNGNPVVVTLQDDAVTFVPDNRQYISEIKPITSEDAGRFENNTSDTYATLEVEDVFKFYKALQSKSDKVQFILGQLQTAIDSDAAKFFGIKEDRGYYSQSKDIVSARAIAYANALRGLADSKDATPELKAEIEKALNRLEELRSIAEGFNFGVAPREVTPRTPTVRPAAAPKESTDAATFGNVTLAGSVYSDANTIGVGNRPAFFVGQIGRIADRFFSGEVVGDFMVEILGFSTHEGSYVGTPAQLTERIKTVVDSINRFIAKGNTEKGRAEDVLAYVQSMVDDIQARLNNKDISFITRVPKPKIGDPTTAQGQAEAIANAEQSKKERKLTELQARAVAGYVRSVDTESGTVKILKSGRNAQGQLKVRNLVQELVKNVYEGKPLTQEQEQLRVALDMPDSSAKEWWRNAYQGVAYLNIPSVSKAVAKLVTMDSIFRSGKAPSINDKFNGVELSDDDKKALSNAGFVNDDQTIDVSAIKIYGASERGLIYGLLQARQNPDTENDFAVESVIQDISQVVGGTREDVGFTVLRSKDKSEFMANLSKAFAKTAARKKMTAEQARAGIESVVELFDTFVHAASGRRIQMMLHFVEQGAFTRGGKAPVGMQYTRSQRTGQIEFNAELAADLRPLYDRLRQLLDVQPRGNLNAVLSAKSNREKVAAAIAQLNEEEASRFYSERLDGIAHFDKIPDVNDALGAIARVYDPTQGAAVNIIMAFKAADVTTFVHEVAHAMFEAFPTALKDDLSVALGHTLRAPTITNPSVLTYEAQEKFAYGLETQLANWANSDDWVAQNAGKNRDASKLVQDLLDRAGRVVEDAYQALSVPKIAGKWTKLWQVKYAANGRIYLWNGAPVLLDPNQYGTQFGVVRQNFGTTKNPNRLVQVEVDGQIRTIPNGDILAIGGPADGLNPAVMQVLSTWIAARRNKGYGGLVQSTPEGRKKALSRDASGRVVAVNAAVQSADRGALNNTNIDNLLRAFGLEAIPDLQRQIIIDAFGAEALRNAILNVPKLSAEYIKNRLRSSEQDNINNTLTRLYAEARIVARLKANQDKFKGSPDSPQYRLAKSILDAWQDTSRTHPQRGKLWAAVNAARRVIIANRAVLDEVQSQLNQIKSGKGKSNWRIKTVNGSPAYNKQQNTITIIQSKSRRNKTPLETEFIVNLKDGTYRQVTPGQQAVAEFIVPDVTVKERSADFPLDIPGGSIADINAETVKAFQAIGFTTQPFRVFTPVYFIAEALIHDAESRKEFGDEAFARSESFLAQASSPLVVSNNELPESASDATVMAQYDMGQLNRVVTPTISVPDMIVGDRAGIIEQAMQEGNVAQAMQSSGNTTVELNPEAKAKRDKWIVDTLAALDKESNDALSASLEDWKKKNPGKEPILYRYEAYVLTDIFNVEEQQPWYTDQYTPEGEQKVRRERVRTIIFSYDDLTKVAPPKNEPGAYQQIKFWESDRWGSSTEFSPSNSQIRRLAIGDDVWVNVDSRKKVDPSKSSVGKEFARGAEARVREIARRWPSQYNAALEPSSAIDPSMGWMPSNVTLVASTRTKTLADKSKVTVVVPTVSPAPKAYAFDVVEGNSAWSKTLNVVSLTENPVGPRLYTGSRFASVDKGMQSRFETDGAHQAVVFPVIDPNTGTTRFVYRMLVRNDKLNYVVQTDVNYDGKGGPIGYATAKEASDAAATQHDLLFGLARAKQEEDVARRVASETVQILEVAQSAFQKIQQGKRLSAVERNAINIVKQFTWYKSMEQRLVGTYGQFATSMADFLGATSPQTPVWQNYLATVFLMQTGVGTHRRRVAIGNSTAARNEALGRMLTVTKKGETEIDVNGAIAVVEADVKRTLTVKRLHDGLIARYGAMQQQKPNLTIDNYREVMSDLPDWSGKSWVELFESEVPEQKRSEVLDSFAEYLVAGRSRTDGKTKKDIQFRSFVNEVDDWVEHKGDVVRYQKNRPVQTIGKLPAGTKLSLGETVIPRNLTSGKLFGSNSQNILLALANEWLTVQKDMSPKARNFALNFIGLSKGATIDVWAARLTRRHTNEYFMGLQTVMSPDGTETTEVVDPEKYENWQKLPEAEQKQYFRLMPMQEQGVKGGYVPNVKNAVNLNGYFAPDGTMVAPTLAAEDRQYTDVRDARISGEFGAANRIFAEATKKVNTAIGQADFMSPSDLQAVVWFAEKARWADKGWTTAAGAGGSFEQMYNEIAYRSGGYRRGTVTVGFRDGSGIGLTTEERNNILDLVTGPFIRERKRTFKPDMGDVQELLLTEEKTELLPAPSVGAMMVNVLNRREFSPDVEGKASGQISLTAMLSRGRKEKSDKYVGDVPLVVVPKEVMKKVALQLRGGKFVYLPVSNPNNARMRLADLGFGRRFVFGITHSGVPRLVGSAVVDAMDIVSAEDVPDTEKSESGAQEYVRLSLREEQPNVDSAVVLHGEGGYDKKQLDSDGSRVFGAEVARPRNVGIEQYFNDIETGVSDSLTHFGTVPVEIVKKANGKATESVLPFPPRVAKSDPGNVGAFFESAMNLLSGVRDVEDAFITTIDTVESTDDPLYDPKAGAMSLVPGPDSYQKIAPESNLRYGAFFLLEAPVGQQRSVPGEEQRIMQKIRRIITKMQESLPNVGYAFRIDADARDTYSDITGTKGMVPVEIVFSPEQFIRDFVALPDMGDDVPDSEYDRKRLFDAYISGDVNVIRMAEAFLVRSLRDIVAEIDADPELAGGIVLRTESVYNGHAIPKELVKRSEGNLEILAREEYLRRSDPSYGIGRAVEEYSRQIGKTSYAEPSDEFYVSSADRRVENPSSVIHDWASISDSTVMMQARDNSVHASSPVPSTNRKGQKVFDVVTAAFAGTTRRGFDAVYQSAMDDLQNGRYSSFLKKMEYFSEVTEEEYANALDGIDVEWSASINASVIAGDAKPTIIGTIEAKEPEFVRIMGRLARLGKNLAQPNVFITTDANAERFGPSSDGSVVVPSIRIELPRRLDPTELRLLADTNPAVFGGIKQSSDGRVVELFMVPGDSVSRESANAWYSEASDFAARFFDLQAASTAPAESYSPQDMQRLSLEVAPGEGSPAEALVGDAWYSLPPDVQQSLNRELTQSAVDVVERIMGVRLKSVVFGLGGWQTFQNASTVVQSNLSPRDAEIAANMLGYVLQQTAVWSNRVEPATAKSKAFAIDFMESGTRTLADSAELAKVWKQLVDADTTSASEDEKLFQGFQPIRGANGEVGIRVIIKSVGDQTKSQIDALLSGPIRSAVESMPIDLTVSRYGCRLIEAENNWKDNPNGEVYLERLGNLLGSDAGRAASELDTARRELERKLESAIKAGKAEGPTFTKTRKRLWNIGSSENGGQGKFLEYDNVLSVVSSLASDDAVSSPEKVTNRTNKRLLKEMEGVLSLLYGKPVSLPERVRFKRTRMHSQLQMEIANHFDLMPLTAIESDPFVVKAYKALTKELDKQFRALNLTVEYMPYQVGPDGVVLRDEDGYEQFYDPYQTQSELVIRDMQENRHLYIYPTTPATFGDSSVNWTDHPLLEKSPFKTTDGKDMLWNDVLRAVHDAIAHGTYGASFGKDGEEKAYVTHALITQDPWAIWALASETRLQNSWVHFNKNNIDEFGQPKPWNADEGSRYSDQKAALCSLDCLYTGLNQIDDRLRLFSQLLKQKFDGYNGTVDYLRKTNPDLLPEAAKTEDGAVENSGTTNAITAFGGQAVIINDPSMDKEIEIDLRNQVIRGKVFSTDIGAENEGKISTIFSSVEMTPEQIMKEFAIDPDDASVMRSVTGLVETPTARDRAIAAFKLIGRGLNIVSRIARLGAAGDASPILNQNWLLANPLENPELLMRQLKLQMQVLANPNVGFQRKDGTIVRPEGMRGRKFFDETLESEVRSRRTYSDAKNAGLFLTAAVREDALDRLRQTDPSATYAQMDELGYDSDVAVEAGWLKHVPGQGPSERFFSLSKDIVKMAAFDQFADTLIQLGYVQTPFDVDADGNPIETTWTKAMKEVAAVINLASGDIKFSSVDQTDRLVAFFGKIFFYSPRWSTSRLFTSQIGRAIFESVTGEWGNKILTINRLNRNQIKNRDINVTKYHQKLMWKAYAQWLAVVMALLLGRNLFNSSTMKVSIEGMGTKIKIGDFSFRPPGGLFYPIQLISSVADTLEKIGKSDIKNKTPKDQMIAVLQAISGGMIPRSGPLTTLASEAVTKRDSFGSPAFIPDEAVNAFYQEVIRPGIEKGGIKGPKELLINKAITSRVMWWWLRDGIETYYANRRVGMDNANSVLRGAFVGAISAEGGRVQYHPRVFKWMRERDKNLIASPDLIQEWLVGSPAEPVETPDFSEDESDYKSPVTPPLFGAPGDYLQQDTRYEFNP